MKRIIKFSVAMIILTLAMLAIPKLYYISALGWCNVSFVCVMPFLIYGAVKEKYDPSSPRYLKSVVPYVVIIIAEILLFYFVGIIYLFGFFTSDCLAVMLVFVPVLLLFVILSALCGGLFSLRIFKGEDGVRLKVIRFLLKHPFVFLTVIFAVGVGMFFLLNYLIYVRNDRFTILITLMGYFRFEFICASFVTSLAAAYGYHAIRRSENKLAFALKYFSMLLAFIAVVVVVFVLFLTNSRQLFSATYLFYVPWTMEKNETIISVICVMGVLPLLEAATSLVSGALSGRKRERKQNEI